jgi:hypothetical protein
MDINDWVIVTLFLAWVATIVTFMLEIIGVL